MDFLIFLLCNIVTLSGLIYAHRTSKECLVAYITCMSIIATMLSNVVITFGTLSFSYAEGIYLAVPLGCNLLQEEYGQEYAKKMLDISIFCLTIITTILLGGSLIAKSSTSFLSYSPRLCMASLASFFICQHIDLSLFTQFGRIIPSTSFYLRSTTTMAISQALLDTILFGFLGLYGMIDHLQSVLFTSFCIKMTILMLQNSSIAIISRILKKNYV
jgi:queuosine precursor transporter